MSKEAIELDIEGVKVIHEIYQQEDSTDLSHTVTIKDDHGNEVIVTIAYGKIISAWKK